MKRLYNIDPAIRYDKLEDLINLPIVIKVNEFDEEAVDDFEVDMEKAHGTGQTFVPIIIDSYGGSVYGVKAMIASIEGSKLPVATILTGKAMSAGAVLFSFGTEGYRFMHPHATMMIHDAGSASWGKVEEMKADIRHIDEINKVMYRRMSIHLGHEPGYIGRLIKDHNHVDWFLTAKEAKKHKIANHLRIPDLNVNLKVSFSLK